MIYKFAALELVDTYRTLNPNTTGYTEDTDRNVMRWNQKLIEKHYRYDGILFRSTNAFCKPSKSLDYHVVNKYHTIHHQTVLISRHLMLLLLIQNLYIHN